MSRRVLNVCAALLVAMTAGRALAAARIDKPRPVSAAERTAVAVVARYLAAGPEPVWNALAKTSPLRALGHDRALREIEARLGPREDAGWWLETVVPSLRDKAAAFGVAYPSGADDSVVFEMTAEGNGWAITTIRTSGEPLPPAAVLAPPQPKHRDPMREWIDTRLALTAALPAAMLAALALVMRRARPRIAGAVALVAAAGLAGAATIVTLLALPPRAVVMEAPRTAAASVPRFVPMESLVPLRQALAAGDAAAMRSAIASLPQGDARDVAALWKVQLGLLTEQDASVERELAKLRWARQTPLARILKARASYLANRMTDTVLAYEEALGSGTGRDTLLLEIGVTLGSLGFDDRARGYFRQATANGSREPSFYYSSAMLAAMDGDALRAQDWFLSAWKMQPLTRNAVLGMPVLWQTLRSPAVAEELQLQSANEAKFATPPTQPIELAAGASAEVVGDCLLVRAGEAQLRVPGGASIAPAGAAILDAAAWQKRDEERVLAEYPEVRARASSPAALADPQLRNRILLAAETLADRNRWSDVLELTSPFSARDERVPIELMVQRGYALSRAKMQPELRNLIAGLLQNPVVKRRREPSVMISIADLLGAVDKWDAAASMLAKVQQELDMPGLEERIEQLRIEKSLAQEYRVVKTDHFDIVYPPVFSEAGAKRAGEILESEYVRLRRDWLPGVQLRRTKVNMLWWEDFQDYAGSDYIAGLYTDEIFLPMAGVETFVPEIVAIMTHELFHAMLASETNDLAPRWFQEAFASRVEMAELKRNAFQHYRDGGFVSVALLDAVANESPDPEMIGSAYEIGEWTLRFIQAKWGKPGLQRLVREFAAGRTTEEAVRNALGTSVADLDRMAREWGAAQPPLSSIEVVRYDGYEPARGTLSVGSTRGESSRW